MRRAVFLVFLLTVGVFARAGYLAHATRSPRVQVTATARALEAIPSGIPLGVRTYLREETSLPLFRVLYQYGENLAAPDGAYGANIGASRSHWLLEDQRAGAIDVVAGVSRQALALITEGLRMFHFGLVRQSADGRFPGTPWPFHDTAMFLAEAAPSLIVLRYSPMFARYRSEISWETVRMHRAARAMVRIVGGPGKIDDATKTHRYFEAALALEAVGVLTSDRQLQRWSTRYVRLGEARTGQDGVMPEDGGHDSGYQALGLTYATRYLAFVDGTPQYHPLYLAVQRGESWEASRVRPDGTINQLGDTRTAGCRERDPLGRCKTTFYAPIFNALTRWSVISDDTRYERVALRVWLINWALQPGDVLPPPGLHADPSAVRLGQWLTVSGTRFQPLERVRVYLAGRLMAKVACDQIGSFGGHSPLPNAHFPLPALSPGRYAVIARGSFGTIRRTTILVAD